MKNVTANELLTAKQLAQLNAFNDGTNNERDLAAMTATGQMAKTLKAIQTEAKIEELFKQFQKSKHTNIVMFARYFSWVSGSFIDGGKLPPCPTNLKGFLDYDHVIMTWVYATESEKTQRIRAPKASVIVDIIARVKRELASIKTTEATETVEVTETV